MSDDIFSTIGVMECLDKTLPKINGIRYKVFGQYLQKCDIYLAKTVLKPELKNII